MELYFEAFNFYYPDTLNLLRLAGAELVPFSPLHESALPENIGGIYLHPLQSYAQGSLDCLYVPV
jgi:cobyrinic acid a,c-diamide synthase